MSPDLDALRERARTVWSGGDYTQLAKLIEPVADALVEVCGVEPGQQVLDVAAGNGNFAVAAARAGAHVVACDLTPAMVELGRTRTEEDGFDVEWLVADAEELPFADDRFDCVASVFGAMFAPRPERAIAELHRVARPQGVVGMANWPPDGFMGEQFAVGRRYAPPPEGVPAPTDWGDERIVAQRIDGYLEGVALERRTVAYEFRSLDAMREWFERNAPQSAAAREAMPSDTYAAMRAEFDGLVERWNVATDGSVRVEPEYLLVTGRKRS